MATKVLDGLDLQNQQIKNQADGSAATDSATWGQVQQLVAGLSWKDEVRAASTANVDPTSTPSSIDGVNLANGMRVLLKNQTDPKQNGIWVAGATGAAMTRASDATTAAQLNNATVLVTDGGTNIDTAWTQTAKDVTVGTSAITFVQFGAGMTYSAGNGLTLTSGTFAIKLPSSGVVGLIVDGTGIYVDTTVLVRKYSANIGNGTLTTITVNHNLGTTDVEVVVREVSTGSQVWITPTVVDPNNVSFTFPSAPASNQYRVTVQA